ncbi:MAG: glycosyltransferase [Myxococcales bacterium]|nr:glycosyltransferase [Myxococcales bacterium]
MELSIVIPVYNEEASIDPMVERLSSILSDLPSPLEVIFVNDGSRDATEEKLLDAKASHPWLRVVNLRRNFGQHIATYAGFDHSEGRLVVTLDGDLQNDPADIPKIVEKLDEGYDIVCGWRMDRKDAFLSRRVPSLVVNWVIRRDSPHPIHDSGCFLRGYTKEAAEEISRYSSTRSWFPVMFAKLGFRVTEVEVRHHARPDEEDSRHGTITRISQFLSILVGATDNPFLYVVIAGMAAITVSFGALVAAALSLIVGGLSAALTWAVVAIVLAVWGTLVTVSGVVGEYVARVHHEIGRTPRYLVRDIK